ncbi:MAG: hypothetical protein P9M00_07160 [Candidatus Tritonobacter lacicola]|nr:hypothetical protein [Candidatus Tritonobacter lacicola]
MKIVYIVHTFLLLIAIAITAAVLLLVVRPDAGRGNSVDLGIMAAGETKSVMHDIDGVTQNENIYSRH